MRFYNQQHRHYCGIDLHARKMFVCIIDSRGKKKVHENIKTNPEAFFDLIFPYLDDIIVGVECVFCPESSSGSSTGNGLQIFATNTKFRSFSVTHYT